MTTWPKHPNGANKKIGEMTEAEKREQFAAAANRIKREMETPAFAAALDSFTTTKQ